MLAQANRVGRFTSSQMYRLMGFDRSGKFPGAPFYTYVTEKRYEMNLGRPMDGLAFTREMAWGKLMEFFAFQEMGIDWTLCSQETIVNPENPNHSGTPDARKTDAAGELKCYFPKNFMAFSEALKSKDVSRIKKECPEEYWQVGSNAEIIKVPNVELFAYMPKESKLLEIRELLQDDGQWLEDNLGEPIERWHNYRFISESPMQSLPWTPDAVDYPSLHSFNFKFPVEDLCFMRDRLKMAVDERDK